MRKYRRAKIEALEWLQKRGQERGYKPEINGLILREPPRLLARTRASVAQQGSLNFKVNDEVEYETDKFDEVYLIVFNLHRPNTWSSRDSFYPLTLSLIKDLANEDVNGDYPVTINLSDPRIKQWENSIDRLFPDNEEVKSPAERINDDQTQRLNNIARGL